MVKPCPWCKEEPTTITWEFGFKTYVKCINEKCPVQPSGIDYDTLKLAIKAWNS